MLLSHVIVYDDHSRLAVCWVPQGHPGAWGPSVLLPCHPLGLWPRGLDHRWVAGASLFSLVGRGRTAWGWWEGTPKAEAWEKHASLANICHWQERNHTERPTCRNIWDLESGCVPWRKGKISAGGQLAVSALRLGAGWAGGPHESYGLEHKPRGRLSLWEALALSPHTRANCPPRTLGQQTTMTHVCLANFAVSRMYSTVLSKMMPSFLPCASGCLRETHGSPRNLLGDGRVCWRGVSKKQTPR